MFYINSGKKQPEFFIYILVFMYNVWFLIKKDKKMDINKIAKKILSTKKVSIRQLLKMNIYLQITSEQDDSFIIQFSGPVNLTQDGIIRWTSNGTFDVELLINGYSGRIISQLNDNQLKNVCSLFNTINGNVNEDTYQKYILTQEN